MTEKKRKGGFATLDRERMAQIAGMGGKAAHAKGTAHRFTSEQARAAALKGAAVRRAKALAKHQPPTTNP